ncbi:MAG: hypothetical protein LBP61_04650, partial [Desulfovibrio sp.]|nr:hypothetical protein [Desulfovibrio sp.]
MQSDYSPDKGVAFFRESSAFRRLAYFLSSPEFFSLQEARRLNPEASRIYRRSLAKLRKHLRTLEQAALKEPSQVSRAAAITSSVHAALSGVLTPLPGEAPEEAISRLEQAVAELGAAALDAARTDPRETSFPHPGQPESPSPVFSPPRQAILPPCALSPAPGRKNAGRPPDSPSQAAGDPDMAAENGADGGKGAVPT